MIELLLNSAPSSLQEGGFCLASLLILSFSFTAGLAFQSFAK